MHIEEQSVNIQFWSNNQVCFFYSWIERICVLEIYVFLNHPLMMDEKMQSRCFFSRNVIKHYALTIRAVILSNFK